VSVVTEPEDVGGREAF